MVLSPERVAFFLQRKREKNKRQGLRDVMLEEKTKGRALTKRLRKQEGNQEKRVTEQSLEERASTRRRWSDS